MKDKNKMCSPIQPLATTPLPQKNIIYLTTYKELDLKKQSADDLSFFPGGSGYFSWIVFREHVAACDTLQFALASTESTLCHIESYCTTIWPLFHPYKMWSNLQCLLHKCLYGRKSILCPEFHYKHQELTELLLILLNEELYQIVPPLTHQNMSVNETAAAG